MDKDHIQHLIIRYLSKEASPDEESELLDWVFKDPSNQQYFNDWKQIWNGEPIAEPTFNINEGLSRLNNAIDEAEVKHNVYRWRKLAASVSILLTVSFITYFAAQRLSADTASIVYQEQITKPGQRTTLTLNDGSTIILNANSSLKYPTEFKHCKREIFLMGEAFFQVAEDHTRPFIIHTGRLTTQVLGTSFNIQSSKKSVTVSVATGQVKVTDGDVNEVIHPKEKIVYDFSIKRIAKLGTTLEHELAWKDNIIIFQDSPLSQVAFKLYEFYGVSVQFENENLKKCLITGKFSNKPIEVVLNAITFATGQHYRTTGNTITFYGIGCE